jgi:aspartyl-tRNA(Asn)/glutamyl-tRNA(Gln) amidotransferase subunit C
MRRLHYQRISMSQEAPDLAGLARLAIGDDASTQIATDLHAIIEMINTMQAVDTQDVEPLSHPLDSTARLRCDEVTESPNPTHFQSGAPSTVDQYYLVPRVVE